MDGLAPLFLFVLFPVLVVTFAGCAAPTSEDKEIDTVDVTPGLEVDTSGDEQARARQPALSGILPTDFPRDLPLYLPASLVDYGESEAGRPTVTLLTADEISRVRRDLHAKLAAAGWESSSGAAGTEVLKKGGARAWLVLEDGRPGTRYRYEYQR